MLLGHLLDRLIKFGTLKLIDAHGKTHVYGNSEGPSSTIRLHDPALHYKLFFHPDLYLGEAYMDGTFTIEEGDLYGFLDLVMSNMARQQQLPPQIGSTLLPRLLRPLRTFNPRNRAKRNVSHHYDLSGRLYDLFLDNDRQYSCAYFTSGNESLEVAQDNKKRHVASKLLLDDGHKVLDIGSGWGGLGIFLARMANNIRVTGVTLSEEQLRVSRERAIKAGVADRVEFALRDYRDETGQYDRIVSVGMFEHVGPNHYAQFFQKVKDLLTDDGVCLLHSIGRMERPSGTSAWIRKYIFPGGYVPAFTEVFKAVEKVGLWVTDVEVLRLHYARTLREWRRRFLANRDEVLKIYDERFCRMWEYYLAASECTFRYMRQMVLQMQISKRIDAVPFTRDYMFDWEREHATERNLSASAHAS